MAADPLIIGVPRWLIIVDEIQRVNTPISQGRNTRSGIFGRLLNDFVSVDICILCTRHSPASRHVFPASQLTRLELSTSL